MRLYNIPSCICAINTTLEAHQEALDGKGTTYDTMTDFWNGMGIKRRVKS